MPAAKGSMTSSHIAPQTSLGVGNTSTANGQMLWMTSIEISQTAGSRMLDGGLEVYSDLHRWIPFMFSDDEETLEECLELQAEGGERLRTVLNPQKGGVRLRADFGKSWTRFVVLQLLDLDDL